MTRACLVTPTPVRAKTLGGVVVGIPFLENNASDIGFGFVGKGEAVKPGTMLSIVDAQIHKRFDAGLDIGNWLFTHFGYSLGSLFGREP